MPAKNTTSQQRAHHLFCALQNLAEDNKALRAAAVARCLNEEGIRVDGVWLRHLDFPNDWIEDVEVLEVDGALVDATGIHENWEHAAIAHGSTLKNYKEGMPLRGDPVEGDWIGNMELPALTKAMNALRAKLQQEALDSATPTSAYHSLGRRF